MVKRMVSFYLKHNSDKCDKGMQFRRVGGGPFLYLTTGGRIRNSEKTISEGLSHLIASQFRKRKIGPNT